MTAPLFIVGCERSGTTLVRELTCLLEGVYLPPDELQLLQYFIGTQAPVKPGTDEVRLLMNSNFAANLGSKSLWLDEQDLNQLVASSGSRASLLEALVAELAQNSGLNSTELQYWGDKTPQNLSLWREISEVWPNARFLLVVRQPDSVVASMMSAWRRSLTRSALIWRESALEAAELLANRPTTTFVCRYEEVCSDPLRFLADVSTWLSVDAPTTLDGFQTRERWGRTSGMSGVIPAPVSSGLSGAQQKRVFGIASEGVSRLGLETPPELGRHDSSMPPAALIFLLRIRDGIMSYLVYAQHRGVLGAFRYKAKQWTKRSQTVAT